MNGKYRIAFWSMLCLCLLGSECQKKETFGQIALKFSFSVDEEELQIGKMIYTNALGNLYQVDEVKYFISDIQLFYDQGKQLSITDNQSIHYIDNNIPSTLQWNIADHIPVGSYDSIRFTFGLPPAKNISNSFVNPPESNMAWPRELGGGYHYMQINGKWDNGSNYSPFLLHTGIGTVYNADSSVQHIHNHFTVTLANANITIEPDKRSSLTLNMNINNWFSNPHDFDLRIWADQPIMQSQEAQLMLKGNGWNIFRGSYN